MPRRTIKSVKPAVKKMLQLKKRAVAHVKKTRTKVHALPISQLVPNVLTICAICMGLSAIRFALAGKISAAILSIAVAALLDGMDGRIARFLHAESDFGAQFDSLADFASFGIAPALITYMTVFSHTNIRQWLLCLFFVFCQAVRLARYNTQLQQHSKKPRRFFQGVPAPMGALVGLYPHIVALAAEKNIPVMMHECFLFCAGCLMASRIPTYSFGAITMTHKMIRPVLIGTGVILATLVGETWLTLSLVVPLYLLMIPFSWHDFKKHKHAQNQS